MQPYYQQGGTSESIYASAQPEQQPACLPPPFSPGTPAHLLHAGHDRGDTRGSACCCAPPEAPAIPRGPRVSRHSRPAMQEQAAVLLLGRFPAAQQPAAAATVEGATRKRANPVHART